MTAFLRGLVIVFGALFVGVAGLPHMMACIGDPERFGPPWIERYLDWINDRL